MLNNWFQTEECYNFYKSLSFLEAFKYEVRRDGEVKGKIVGYIQKDGGKLKRFFSRRAIINGGPVLAGDITDDELKSLLEGCRKALKGKAIYVESRNFDDYSAYRAIFEKCGWRYEPHYNFHIGTASAEVVESNLGKSRKRDIRTSLRDGAVYGEAVNLDEVKELYRILEKLYHKKVKTPLFPFEFFEKFCNTPFGKVFAVRFEGHIVGGTVCVCGEDVVYEWFACGEDGVSKSVFPSTLATYAGIKYAAEHGYKRFDMMGAGAPDDGGYGVRGFKAKFGGKLVEYGRFKYIENPFLYKIGEFGVKLLKRMK